MDWRDFLQNRGAADQSALFGVHPKSVTELSGGLLMLAREDGTDKLIVTGPAAEKFTGEKQGDALVCETDAENAAALMALLPDYAPRSHRGHDATLGLGDRLGFATPGHLRAVAKTEVFPVCAQQSMRELGLTKRGYRDVIASAAFGALREGWTRGYGADGDHLKKKDEVQSAIDAGCTMITLDLSGVLDKEALTLSDTALDAAFSAAFGREGVALAERYTATAAPGLAPMGAGEAKCYALAYRAALDFVAELYEDIIKGCDRDIDLEISLDETEAETTPAQHLYVASELKRRGVPIVSLAPRFPGEFQKAVDYRGDLKELTEALNVHHQVAKALGHKLSIHSGSDKWSVFPLVALTSGGRYHLKTSGTNWLEAVKMIAFQNPALYRRIHAHAITVYAEAQKNYHTSGNPARVPALYTLSDDQLPDLFDQDDARQLMHITYGQLLNDAAPDGAPLFRDEIFTTLRAGEERYADLLERHIGRHLELLGEWSSLQVGPGGVLIQTEP